MAGNAAFLFHFQQHHIGIAVEPDIPEHLLVPGALALAPEFATGTGPVHRLSFLNREPERFPVHPGHHQDIAIIGVLGNGRHQTVFCPLDLVEPVRLYDVSGRILHFYES